MRHIRITGQNIKNLAVFKNQIGGILKELNKFDEKDKNEAMSYLRSCVNGDTNPSSSSLGTSSESPKATRRKKRKATEKVSSYTTFLRKRSYSSARKNIKHNRNKKVKYTNSSSVPLTKTIFKCKSCNAVEKTKRNMLKHVETHVGAPLSCIKCKRTFNGSIPFKWHLNHYCNPRFYANWKFKCNQCPREFMSKRTLESHLQGHKRNNCSYCDKVLTRRVHLIRHLLEVHSIKLERDTYKCEHCEKRYIKKCSLYYHLRQHVPDKFVCLECGHIDNTIEEHEEHKKQHDLQKHFSCSKCGEKFSRRQQFLYHMKRHNRYKCVTCDESYASRAKVTRHKQQGHQVEGLNPRFICPHCPIAFHRENRFHIHMRKHTEENRSVNCKYCKKTFNSPYAYYKHCITINHEKFSPEISDIVCDKCGKHFAKRYDLRQHMYRVHNVSKQLVACQYCDYKTVHKCNMDRHVALHLRKNSQFTCEYCGKSCDSIASLKDHITYNHIQEKQFKCDKCDKSFKRNSELVRHQDSHSDERPHVCTLCGKTYKRLNHLKRHEKRAHEIVKETRRIKKITTEPEVPIAETATVEEVKNQPQSSTKIVFLQPSLSDAKYTLRDQHENVLINFSGSSDTSGNIMDQLSCFLPDRGWGIENEDLYKVYNDVPMNYGNQDLAEAQENENLTDVQNITCGQ